MSCKNCPAWRDSAFADLSDLDLERLNREKSQITRRRGDSFSEMGKPATEIYCLRSGSAKVTLFDSVSGRESLVRLVRPGEILGYRCVFSSETFRGTASPLTESVACKISKDFALDLIQHEPKFSQELLRRMGLEVAAAEYHHHSFCQKRVRERLAEALLILKDKFGEKSDLGWKINTRLTRRELSNWIGASRETVIRGLADFSEEALISQIDDSLYITDVIQLTKVSGTQWQKPLPEASL